MPFHIEGPTPAVSATAVWFSAAITSIFVFTNIACCQTPKKSNGRDIPSFSANAVVIYDEDDTVKTTTSPDGKKELSIETLDIDSHDSEARITVSTKQRHLTATIGFWLDTEVLWSPDSRAFAITGSDGGAVGQFETDVFYIGEKELTKVEPTPLIERAFGHPVSCHSPEPPNVVAVKWMVPSEKLLMAAEILPHSNCDSMGTFTAYVVDLAGTRVVQVLNQLDAKRLYREDFGLELLDADDDCIRHPKDCSAFPDQ